MYDEYGVFQTNPIDDEVKQFRDEIVGECDFGDPTLVQINRLRLISDPGFPMWDLSYCYGTLANGDRVRVHLPQHQFSKRNLKRDLVEMCKSCGVYGKGIGILDEGVISKCM